VAARRGRRGPDPYEDLARQRLEPILGPLREIDPGGGPRPLHDFEATLPDSSVAAIEVTSQLDRKRREQTASAQRRFHEERLPGSELAWQVALERGARVNDIDPGDLHRLLHDMEAKGLPTAHGVGDYRDPFVERLAALRVEFIYAGPARPGRQGVVRVVPGTYSSRGWNGADIDAWLDSFLTSREGVNRLGKLARASGAAQRHLAIVLDLFSQAGMGISLSLSDRDEEGAAGAPIPSFVPPDPLTHLWLMQVVEVWEGLLWTHGAGWRVLAPSSRSDPSAIAL